MKTLKALREELRAFNLDTDEELDLDALADMDLDSLLGGGDGFGDEEETEYTPLDFGDLSDINIDDYVDDDGEFNPDSDLEGDTEGLEDPGLGDMEGIEGMEGEDDLGMDGDIDIDSFELGDEEMEGEEGEVPQEDQDFQGEIRTVRGANLVYKRKTDDGNFEELWIYNVGNDIKRETQVRRAILAGTDVDPGSQESKDGSQRADTTTAGNVQFLHIVGLPQ